MGESESDGENEEDDEEDNNEDDECLPSTKRIDVVRCIRSIMDALAPEAFSNGLLCSGAFVMDCWVEGVRVHRTMAQTTRAIMRRVRRTVRTALTVEKVKLGVDERGDGILGVCVYCVY